MVAATYGFVSAFGQNIALIPTLTTAMKWFPNNKGTAMGIVVGGFGGGALVFNQIQTALVNLENYKVDSLHSAAPFHIGQEYFSKVGLEFLFMCTCVISRILLRKIKRGCSSRMSIGLGSQ